MFDWRRLMDPTQERRDNRHWRSELTDLVMKDPAVREDGRRVTQHNLLALCWVLGFCLVDETVHHEALNYFLPKDPELLLDEWLHHAAKHYQRRGSLILPRGVYKTTISLANCAQLIICWPLTIAIMIMSGRGDLAKDFVDQVAGFFIQRSKTRPTLFQALWPELCVDSQGDSGEFTAAQRQSKPNIIEPAIWGESVEAGISGYHPNVLIVDDCSNNRNSQKYETRANTTKKYKLARKVLLPVGIELKVGTIYGTGDIFCDEVLTARPGSIRRILKSSLSLKNGDRLDANGFPDEDDIILHFPTILDYEYLRSEYESGFESFMSQYQNDEYGSADVVFAQQQMLAAMVEEAQLPLEGKTLMHWRFPCARRNWKTAACAVGQLYRNRCYIVDVMEGHYRPSILAKLVVTTARKYHLHRITIEESPGARLMASAIQNYALTTGWEIGLQWVGAEAGEEDTGQRDLRIRNIEAVLSTGRLLFYAGLKQLKPLMLEFSQYSMIPEDAIPDVVSRVADNLPQSIAAEDLEDEDASYKSAMERDRYNLIYNRGPYARVEAEPEDAEVEDERIEDRQLTDQGLEVWIPGLE
jgi:hypothetical protein